MGHLAACGGATTADVKDAAVGDVSAPDAKLEASSPDASPPPSDTSTFAIQKIYLGEAARTGAPSNVAWKKFGYNLDGKVTVPSSTDVCTRALGAPSSNQNDGDLGIDNAFGASILPIIQSAASISDPSATASAQFQTGKGTYQISIKGLGADPNQTATGLSGGVFLSLDYRGDSVVAVPFPGFGPTTDWPVRVEGLANGLTIAGGPKLAFGKADVSNGTFAGSGLDFPVSISFGGLGVTLLIHHAIVTFDHTSPGTAANGTIAGVLDTEEFILELKKAAGLISPVLCGSQFDGIAQQMRQASDIMLDLSNVAGFSCNAISVGLGFDATLVANPTKIAKAPVPAPPNPCP